MTMNKFKVGDLVKYVPDGDRGIVVKASTTSVWVYWFWDVRRRDWGVHVADIQLLSRGPNNDNE